MNYGAVELGFVHVGNGGFGVKGVFIENIGCSAIGHDYHFGCQRKSHG